MDRWLGLWLTDGEWRWQWRAEQSKVVRVAERGGRKLLLLDEVAYGIRTQGIRGRWLPAAYGHHHITTRGVARARERTGWPVKRQLWLTSGP
jgi:hypothetical protein